MNSKELTVLGKELSVLENRLPLRAYPEDNLDTILGTVLQYYLADLLSIKAENEDKIISALPAIKKHFWSLGLNEVTKAFKMHAYGQLSTKPISNYFDTILVGQVFKAYKEQKPNPKIIIPEMTPQEKEFKMIEATDRVEKEFKQHGTIIEISHHVYDYLFEKGELPKDKPYKDAIFKKAMELRKNELIQERAVNYSQHKETKDLLKEMTKGNAVVNIAKRLVLEDYFKKNLTKLKND